MTPKTTYVTKPLTKDGYPDYAAAINERMRVGVTPRNNAAVDFFRAIGPAPDGVRMPDAFFAVLGMSIPPVEGKYFVDLPAYLKKQVGLPDNDAQSRRVFDELAAAQRAPWSPQQYPTIAAWLQANEEPLRLAVEATRQKRWFSPMVPGSGESEVVGLAERPLPNVQMGRSLVRCLTARAMRQLADGQTEAAWQDLLACHRLARLLGQGPTTIEALVAFAMDVTTTQADYAFIEHAHLDAGRVAECLRDVDALAALPTMADRFDLFERCSALELPLLMARGEKKRAEELLGPVGGLAGLVQTVGVDAFDWDVALKGVNEWFDRTVAALRLEDGTSRSQALKDLEFELGSLAPVVHDLEHAIANAGRSSSPGEDRGKKVGLVVVKMSLSVAPVARQPEDRGAQVNRNLHVAFALQAYHADHGNFPETLDQLAPKYLAGVPRDLFSGNSLIYKRENGGYLLYSVGLNGEDDDGRSRDDEPQGDDLPVRMPAKNR